MKQRFIRIVTVFFSIVLTVAFCTATAFAATAYFAVRPVSVIEYPNAPYTAMQVGQLFPEFVYLDFYTPYTTVNVASPDNLSTTSFKKQTDITLPVVKQNDAIAPDPQEFANLLTFTLTRLMGAMELSPAEYQAQIEQGATSFGMDLSDMKFSAMQGEKTYQFHLRYPMTYTPAPHSLALNGVAVQVDQTMSDRNMTASLSPIKQVLNDIFGVTYQDLLIKREYSSRSNGASRIDVYFYDDAASINHYSETPVSNYIKLTFNNNSNNNGMGDCSSESILNVTEIYCEFFRNGAEDELLKPTRQRMISLREAESFLYSGYAFMDRHHCPICAELGDPFSFRSYDYVDLIYRFGVFSEDDSIYTGIPVYVFYKEIGTGKNGTLKYAVNYVPAVEVNGYEEYFEAIESVHSK